jgi:hypothetical protein
MFQVDMLKNLRRRLRRKRDLNQALLLCHAAKPVEDHALAAVEQTPVLSVLPAANPI